MDSIKMPGRGAHEISEEYRKMRKKIEDKRKEIDELLKKLDQKQERFIKRRAKLQEMLAELEKDLNVRLGKETVKNENDQKMTEKHREIGDLIDAIPEKTKRLIDSEIEEYSKVFNTQVQNMKKDMAAVNANKTEYPTIN